MTENLNANISANNLLYNKKLTNTPRLIYNSFKRNSIGAFLQLSRKSLIKGYDPNIKIYTITTPMLADNRNKDNKEVAR